MAKQPLGKCDALDSDGHRCRWPAIRVESYHGDHEIYDAFGDQPTWVRVELCARHMSQSNVNKRKR